MILTLSLSVQSMGPGTEGPENPRSSSRDMSFSLGLLRVASLIAFLPWIYSWLADVHLSLKLIYVQPWVGERDTERKRKRVSKLEKVLLGAQVSEPVQVTKIAPLVALKQLCENFHRKRELLS